MIVPPLKGAGWSQALAHAEPARVAAWHAIEGDAAALAPAPEHVFHAFDRSMADVRVVILGQDPYPTPGHATGLAFAVPAHTSPLPPSLRAILTELRADAAEQGWTIPHSTSDSSSPLVSPTLESWAAQGVLLLNTVLTCRVGSSLSHEKCGWQRFTSAVLDALCAQPTPPIAVLWGKHAQTAAMGRAWSHVISSSHPSPLSAHRGFFGSRPFSTVNSLLCASAQTPIDWVDLV